MKCDFTIGLKIRSRSTSAVRGVSLSKGFGKAAKPD